MSDPQRQLHIDELEDRYGFNSNSITTWGQFTLLEAMTAFRHEADLATILTVATAIEAKLRERIASTEFTTFKFLIQTSNYSEDLKDKLHMLRKYRNKWVHKQDKLEHQQVNESLFEIELELENMSFFSISLGCEAIFEN